MNPCVTATFTMPDIPQLAAELSKSTSESFMIWHDALTKGTKLAQDANIDPDAFLMLTRNCNNSAQFLSIMEALHCHAKENPYGSNAFNLLDFFVEKSTFALKDWIEGLDFFCDWLTDNVRQAGLTTMLNYITNCIQDKNQLESDMRFNLKEKVENVLKTYGFQD
ncbi:MAG: hypothetical protein C5B43_04960 [Verrucomicrobia bacterium]|nr:MAG: hypothetical protein C5B43_04960 [Verrucomicrobiota bacterium]